jgi:hypothetical protein
MEQCGRRSAWRQKPIDRRGGQYDTLRPSLTEGKFALSFTHQVMQMKADNEDAAGSSLQPLRYRRVDLQVETPCPPHNILVEYLSYAMDNGCVVAERNWQRRPEVRGEVGQPYIRIDPWKR